MNRSSVAVVLSALALLAGTSCAGPGGSAGDADGSTPPAGGALERVEAVQAAVDGWRRAATLAEARGYAEQARNLVTGPTVAGYGDGDGDGRVRGAVEAGLLPGSGGQPGLVPEPASACVLRDVLGGSWADPPGRWAEVADRIERWTPTGNTFPALPSHPQRVVGWASLALAAGDVEEAREYAGHADLHVDVSRAALTACD